MHRSGLIVAVGSLTLAAIPGMASADSSGKAGLPLVNFAVDEADLLHALDLVGAASGTHIRLHGDARGIRVTGRFERQTVQVVLQRLLSRQSYLLVQNSGHQFAVVLLSPSGPSPVVALPRAVDWRGNEPAPHIVALMSSALAAQDPAERAHSVGAILYAGPAVADRDGPASQAIVAALADAHPQVRIAALHALKDSGDETRSEELVQLIASDADAAVRMLALEILTERDSARASAALRNATVDADPAVRTRARELMAHLHIR